MRVFLVSVAAIVLIAIASQVVLTHVAGESSEAAYSDRSARPD